MRKTTVLLHLIIVILWSQEISNYTFLKGNNGEKHLWNYEDVLLLIHCYDFVYFNLNIMTEDNGIDYPGKAIFTEDNYPNDGYCFRFLEGYNISSTIYSNVIFDSSGKITQGTKGPTQHLKIVSNALSGQYHGRVYNASWDDDAALLTFEEENSIVYYNYTDGVFSGLERYTQDTSGEMLLSGKVECEKKSLSERIFKRSYKRNSTKDKLIVQDSFYINETDDHVTVTRYKMMEGVMYPYTQKVFHLQDNNVVSRIKKNYNSEISDWKPSQSFVEYEYDDSLCMQIVEYSIREDEISKFKKCVYEYNENGLIEKTSIYYKNINDEWELNKEYNFDYNSDGNIISHSSSGESKSVTIHYNNGFPSLIVLNKKFDEYIGLYKAGTAFVLDIRLDIEPIAKTEKGKDAKGLISVRNNALTIPSEYIGGIYKIYSCSGKELIQSNVVSTNISLVNLSSGIYFLEIDNESKRTNKRFFVN